MTNRRRRCGRHRPAAEVLVIFLLLLLVPPSSCGAATTAEDKNESPGLQETSGGVITSSEKRNLDGNNMPNDDLHHGVHQTDRAGHNRDLQSTYAVSYIIMALISDAILVRFDLLEEEAFNNFTTPLPFLNNTLALQDPSLLDLFVNVAGIDQGPSAFVNFSLATPHWGDDGFDTEEMLVNNVISAVKSLAENGGSASLEWNDKNPEVFPSCAVPRPAGEVQSGVWSGIATDTYPAPWTFSGNEKVVWPGQFAVESCVKFTKSVSVDMLGEFSFKQHPALYLIDRFESRGGRDYHLKLGSSRIPTPNVTLTVQHGTLLTPYMSNSFHKPVLIQADITLVDTIGSGDEPPTLTVGPVAIEATNGVTTNLHYEWLFNSTLNSISSKDWVLEHNTMRFSVQSNSGLQVVNGPAYYGGLQLSSEDGFLLVAETKGIFQNELLPKISFTPGIMTDLDELKLTSLVPLLRAISMVLQRTQQNRFFVSKRLPYTNTTLASANSLGPPITANQSKFVQPMPFEERPKKSLRIDAKPLNDAAKMEEDFNLLIVMNKEGVTSLNVNPDDIEQVAVANTSMTANLLRCAVTIPKAMQDNPFEVVLHVGLHNSCNRLGEISDIICWTSLAQCPNQGVINCPPGCRVIFDYNQTSQRFYFETIANYSSGKTNDMSILGLYDNDNPLNSPRNEILGLPLAQAARAPLVPIFQNIREFVDTLETVATPSANSPAAVELKTEWDLDVGTTLEFVRPANSGAPYFEINITTGDYRPAFKSPWGPLTAIGELSNLVVEADAVDNTDKWWSMSSLMGFTTNIRAVLGPDPIQKITFPLLLCPDAQEATVECDATDVAFLISYQLFEQVPVSNMYRMSAAEFGTRNMIEALHAVFTISVGLSVSITRVSEDSSTVGLQFGTNVVFVEIFPEKRCQRPDKTLSEALFQCQDGRDSAVFRNSSIGFQQDMRKRRQSTYWAIGDTTETRIKASAVAPKDTRMAGASGAVEVDITANTGSYELSLRAPFGNGTQQLSFNDWQIGMTRDDGFYPFVANAASEKGITSIQWDLVVAPKAPFDVLSKVMNATNGTVQSLSFDYTSDKSPPYDLPAFDSSTRLWYGDVARCVVQTADILVGTKNNTDNTAVVSCQLDGILGHKVAGVNVFVNLLPGVGIDPCQAVQEPLVRYVQAMAQVEESLQSGEYSTLNDLAKHLVDVLDSGGGEEQVADVLYDFEPFGDGSQAILSTTIDFNSTIKHVQPVNVNIFDVFGKGRTLNENDTVQSILHDIVPIRPNEGVLEFGVQFQAKFVVGTLLTPGVGNSACFLDVGSSIDLRFSQPALIDSFSASLGAMTIPDTSIAVTYNDEVISGEIDFQFVGPNKPVLYSWTGEAPPCSSSQCLQIANNGQASLVADAFDFNWLGGITVAVNGTSASLNKTRFEVIMEFLDLKKQISTGELVIYPGTNNTGPLERPPASIDASAGLLLYQLNRNWPSSPDTYWQVPFGINTIKELIVGPVNGASKGGKLDDNEGFVNGFDCILEALNEALFGETGTLTLFELPYVKSAVTDLLKTGGEGNQSFIEQIRTPLAHQLMNITVQLADVLVFDTLMDVLVKNLNDFLNPFLRDDITYVCFDEGVDIDVASPSNCSTATTRAVFFTFPFGGDLSRSQKLEFDLDSSLPLVLEVSAESDSQIFLNVSWDFTLRVGTSLDRGVLLDVSAKHRQSGEDSGILVSASAFLLGTNSLRAQLFLFKATVQDLNIGVGGGLFLSMDDYVTATKAAFKKNYDASLPAADAMTLAEVVKNTESLFRLGAEFDGQLTIGKLDASHEPVDFDAFGLVLAITGLGDTLDGILPRLVANIAAQFKRTWGTDIPDVHKPGLLLENFDAWCPLSGNLSSCVRLLTPAVDVHSIGEAIAPWINRTLDEMRPIYEVVRELNVPVPGISDIIRHDYSVLDFASMVPNLVPPNLVKSVREFIKIYEELQEAKDELEEGFILIASHCDPRESDRTNRSASSRSKCVGGLYPAPNTTELDSVLGVSPHCNASSCMGGCSACSGFTATARCQLAKAKCKALSISGLEFPILEDPTLLLDLLFGDDVDILTFTSPEVQFAMSFVFRFPLVVAPVQVDIGLDLTFSASSQISFAFDTKGIREAIDAHSSELILNSIAIKIDDNVPLLHVIAGIEVFVDVGVIIARVGAGGGLKFESMLLLQDPSPDTDDAVRPYELITHGYANPLDWFAIQTGIYVVVSVFVEVGLFLGFIEITIFEYDYDANIPILGPYTLAMVEAPSSTPLSLGARNVDLEDLGELRLAETATFSSDARMVCSNLKRTGATTEMISCSVRAEDQTQVTMTKVDVDSIRFVHDQLKNLALSDVQVPVNLRGLDLDNLVLSYETALLPPLINTVTIARSSVRVGFATRLASMVRFGALAHGRIILPSAGLSAGDALAVQIGSDCNTAWDTVGSHSNLLINAAEIGSGCAVTATGSDRPGATVTISFAESTCKDGDRNMVTMYKTADGSFTILEVVRFDPSENKRVDFTVSVDAGFTFFNFDMSGCRDEILIESTLVGAQAIRINTMAGEDQIQLGSGNTPGLEEIFASVRVEGGASHDVLIVDDSRGSPVDDLSEELLAKRINGMLPGVSQLLDYSGVELVIVKLSAGEHRFVVDSTDFESSARLQVGDGTSHDSFKVRSTRGNITIDAEDGDNEITVDAANGDVRINAGTGRDTISVVSARGDVTIVADSQDDVTIGDVGGRVEIIDYEFSCGGPGLLSPCVGINDGSITYNPTAHKLDGTTVDMNIVNYTCSMCNLRNAVVDVKKRGLCRAQVDNSDPAAPSITVTKPGGPGTHLTFAVEICSDPGDCEMKACTVCIDRPDPMCRKVLTAARQRRSLPARGHAPGTGTYGQHQCPPVFLPEVDGFSCATAGAA